MINKEILAEIWDDIENKDKKFFKTGFEELDETIKIEEGKGALITIGARPAMGKTAFALSVTEKILELNKKVLAFSLEMSEKQFVQRFFALNSEVDLMRLKTGYLSQKDYEKLAQGLNNLGNFDLTIDDTSGITTDEIEEKIKENKPDIVLIDYLQLVTGKRKTDRVAQIDDIMKNLKRISKEQGVVIFILSQLSRAVENRIDKRPLLSDFRESGSIENISDVVIFPYRPDYYSYYDDDEIRVKGETEIIVAKNRFGPVGIWHMCFKANIAKFYSGRSNISDIF